MNKRGFIEKIKEEANVSIETATMINDCMEEHFIIGKNTKEKTINDMMERMNISYDEADNYYNIASSIISKAIKNKIRHPFKSQD